MAVYVDNMRMRARVGELIGTWSHMFSDEGPQELDEFAAKLGLKARWLQNKRGFIHYDVTESKRQLAIKLGAVEIDWRDLSSFWDTDEHGNRVLKAKRQS